MSAPGRWRPRARRRDLMVSRLPDEVLIYDLCRSRAFCLDAGLARIWRWCDGKTSLARITRRARRVFGPGAESIDQALIVGALGRLRRARLVEPHDSDPLLTSAERRDFLRRAAAIGGLALVEVAAPRPTVAASCIPSGTCQNLFSPCGGGLPCCGGGTCRTFGSGRCHCR